LVQINNRIVNYEVVPQLTPQPEIKQLIFEDIKRPEVLTSSTYKIKSALSDYSLYVTITNIEINGKLYPREIFINSRNMEQFQWIVALTRMISAVFRKGGDVTFLAEELKSVHDPKGGYYKKGGRFMPSLVAEIGDVLERHLVLIGIIVTTNKTTEYPTNATLCPKCNTKALIKSDGCETCLNCGEGKCG
jgi:hypothetical protein